MICLLRLINFPGNMCFDFDGGRSVFLAVQATSVGVTISVLAAVVKVALKFLLR